jgi:hypothetical protein
MGRLPPQNCQSGSDRFQLNRTASFSPLADDFVHFAYSVFGGSRFRLLNHFCGESTAERRRSDAVADEIADRNAETDSGRGNR